MTAIAGSPPADTPLARAPGVRVGRLAIIAAVSTAIALSAGALAAAAYSARALPGVTVAGIAVGSLEAAQVRERLAAEAAGPWADARVTASYDGRTWPTTNRALGIVPDVDRAAAAAIAYGKSN